MSTTNNRGTVADIVMRLIPKKLPHLKEAQKRQLPRDKHGRLKIQSLLGQLLYNAAKLFDAMDNYRDRKLIDDYLLGDSPLHSRRTLDQAYYWSLRNTKTRDRDQVVYRSTSARPNELHHYDPSDKRWDCAHYEFRAVEPREDSIEEAPQDTFQRHTSTQSAPSTLLTRSRSRMSAVWERATTSTFPNSRSSGHMDEDLETNIQSPTSHTTHNEGCSAKTNHRECLGCREAVQKLPRLIMVDQLWMWILDKDTIITCFPRRYGVNRRDASGVHKAIRTRLSSLGNTQVLSAPDLALVIIDECGKVFFDRTKTDERKPQLVDIFSDAIGKVVSTPISLFLSYNLTESKKRHRNRLCTSTTCGIGQKS